MKLYTQIRGQDHLTVLVKICCPTDQMQLRSGCVQPACMRSPFRTVSAMLTPLLACIPPVFRCSIVYNICQFCFGQLASWQYQITPNTQSIAHYPFLFLTPNTNHPIYPPHPPTPPPPPPNPTTAHCTPHKTYSIIDFTDYRDEQQSSRPEHT